MLKFLKSDLFFFLLTSALILSLNLTPMILQARHTPTGRTFTFVHNNIQDFFFYQALMNEGANGAWTISDPYTTEDHKPSIIFSYFAWLGKISRIFSLPYNLTYHILRLTFAIFTLSAAFYLIKLIKTPHPRLTYLFFLFASPFMHNGSPFMNFWTGMDAIRRAAYLPHHMIGAFLLIFEIILFIKYFRDPKLKIILLSLFLAIPLGFIHTPSLFILLLIILPALILYTGIKSLVEKSRKTNPGIYIGFIIFFCFGAIILALMIRETNQGFPWSQYVEWERRLQFPLESELIPALGILVLPAVFGILQSLFLRKFDYILVAFWLLIPILFIPFAPKLNLSNIRLIQGVPYLPLAILASLGLYFLQKNLLPVFEKLLDLVMFKNVQFAQVKNNWLILLFLPIFIFTSLPTLSWSLKDQIREYWSIFGNVYLDNNLFEAFDYINNNYPPKINTLATFYTGNYLPAFTDTRSFIGHFGYTSNVFEKENKVKDFISNKMKPEEAKELLLSNNITLVFQGPEEKPIFNGYLYPELLLPVFDKNGITIYEIKP